LSPEPIRARPLGDSAITLTLGTERSPDLLARVHALTASLADACVPGVVDIVPAYLTVTAFYDPLKHSYAEISATLLELCGSTGVASAASRKPREHRIPVTYDGPDLAEVAAAAALTVEEVITRHFSPVYTVDIIGFVPGFAYLSELDPALCLPRRSQPRPRVAAGSVAIAGPQTAVYPLDTPGGWHLIGNTSTRMFDPARDPPALLAPGDTVRFVRVR
jgi:KipI family sensor histidine kinase inhibitor